jgi:hypothetical protein
VICQQIFSILALVIFLLNIIVKNVSKLFFFSALASRSGFGAAISVAAALIFFCFATQSLQIAVQAYWSGCADDFPFNFLLESASNSFFRFGVEIRF